ncbi:MAG: helix-turn-helix domain-containing protein [Bacteroidales bacterium]
MDVKLITVEDYLQLTKKLDRILEIVDNDQKTLIPKNYSLKEACKELKVSLRTLMEYKARGYISYIQKNRKILIPQAAITEFLNQNYVNSFSNLKNQKLCKK